MLSKTGEKWSPEASPTYWINHASRLIMWHFDQELRPLEFGMAYLGVAMTLNERGPLLQRDLAENAQVEQPTMAALLARMERDGFIQREPHAHDKRASLVSLTPKAKKRLPIVRERMEACVRKALGGLSQDEVGVMTRLLQRVASNLANDIHEPAK